MPERMSITSIKYAGEKSGYYEYKNNEMNTFPEI